MSAQFLDSKQWKKMLHEQHRLKPDVMRTVWWLFTRAHTHTVRLVSPAAATQMDALQHLYRVAPFLFKVSPIHGPDRHFDIRVDYGNGKGQTLHVIYFPNTNNVKEVTVVMDKKIVPIWWPY
jgi:hypothetical protein